MGFWDWVPKAVEIGATLWGAKQQSDTQNQAANTAVQANQAATAAALEGNRVATSAMERQQAAASPGLMHVQEVIGRGEGLTPAQELSLNDARRTTLDTLHGGSLRGSARATVAAVQDVDGRMRADMIDRNRARADTAATNLSGQYFNSGNQIANLNTSAGNVASAGLINTGNVESANTMGQGIIKGQAIGDIGAIIADQLKSDDNKKRDSSYDPITWNGPRKGAI